MDFQGADRIQVFSIGIMDEACPKIFPNLTEEQLVKLKGLSLEKRLEIAEAFSQLNELAMLDGLTGIPNRRCFTVNLEREIARQERGKKPLSIMIIDIDRFKITNDNFGHLAGDEVLKKITALLKENIRGMDIIARFGGEEFVIILPNTKLAEARKVAENLRKKIENMEIIFQDKIITITASFGVAQRLEDELSSHLVDRADKKLYEAKEAGRNQVVVCDGKIEVSGITTA